MMARPVLKSRTMLKDFPRSVTNSQQRVSRVIFTALLIGKNSDTSQSNVTGRVNPGEEQRDAADLILRSVWATSSAGALT